MAGELSVDFACGQIFFCLRKSNLNYIVNETPYSAYITIRKKFVNKIVETVETTNGATNVNRSENRSENIIKVENEELKETLKELERITALIRIENEELEIKILK